MVVAWVVEGVQTTSWDCCRGVLEGFASRSLRWPILDPNQRPLNDAIRAKVGTTTTKRQNCGGNEGGGDGGWFEKRYLSSLTCT